MRPPHDCIEGDFWQLDLFSQQGLIVTNRDLIILYWNSWLEFHSGHPAKEMIGRPLLECFPRLAEGKTARFYHDAVAGRTTVLSHRLHPALLPMRAVVGTPSGGQMVQSSRIAPLVRNGQVLGTVTTIEDVTERVRREEELRGAHAQIEQMLTHSPAVIYRLKVEGEQIIPITASANVTKLLGFALEETLSVEWWLGQLHTEDRDRAIASISETLRKGVSRVEYRLRHKEGGYRWVEDNRQLVGDASGHSREIFGVWIDITERKRTEAELQSLNRRLLETSRQAGMAEVASGILHNVGNVLNSVNISATLLADTMRQSKIANLPRIADLLREHEMDLAAFLSGDPKGKQLPAYLNQLSEILTTEQDAEVRELDLLRQNIDHIKEIVAAHQNYAQVAGVAETLQICELVEQALRMNASVLAKHEVQVIREFAEVPSITTEKHKVLPVLVNLIRNAGRACEESGRTCKQVRARVVHSDHGVRIAISDNGVGIPAENLARLFNQGFTPRKGGHGPALHDCAIAAKGLGGSLTVRSDGIGCGATFTLELPYGEAALNE